MIEPHVQDRPASMNESRNLKIDIEANHQKLQNSMQDHHHKLTEILKKIRHQSNTFHENQKGSFSF